LASSTLYPEDSVEMARIKELSRYQDASEILSTTGSGWELSLPPNLQMYQGELEELLGKVFSQRPMIPENLALAQQMSLNWCQSKCREVGITFEDDWSKSN
jgi:hypothetical protein